MCRLNIALSGSIKDGGVVSINKNYLSAIWAAGGIPTLLQPDTDDRYIGEVCRYFDGFVFCGGEDIDPKYYGERKNRNTKNICSLRDGFEEKLFYAVYQTGKPILGICRGMQIINVFLGGTLFQHISGHIQKEEKQVCTHTVSVKNGLLLKQITGKNELLVNSFHHQAIKSLSSLLVADAVDTKDGYIEAFHDERHKFLLCVQWHPEACHTSDNASKAIFDAFIAACRQNKAGNTS